MVFKILIQNTDHGAFQNTDLAAIQGFGMGSNRRVGIVLDKVIGFAAHDCFRISDQRGTFLTPRQTGQQIDISVQQHLIEFTKPSIDIFIFPAGIL